MTACEGRNDPVSVEYTNWAGRIDMARKKNDPGRILVLAEEAPVQALAVEAYRTAGQMLCRLGRIEFALEQFEKALAIDPDDMESLQRKGALLGQQVPPAERVAWLEDLAEQYPDNPDTLALSGRVRKEARIGGWRQPGASPEKMISDAASWEPRRVFLFSGHMIDASGRQDPRFPPDKEAVAAKAIADKLDDLGAGSEDLALCGGACGGDILFAEACLARTMHIEVRLAFAILEFLNRSVTFAGETWRDRFYAVRSHPLATFLIMPDELGPTPDKGDPFVRTNLWQLYSALAWGPEKVYCICLWNRKGGDGPGGTKHMYDEVNKRTGQVHVLDTNILFK